jgi:hypothetical protein
MLQKLPELLASIRTLIETMKIKIGEKLGKTEQAADSKLLDGKTLAQITGNTQGRTGELPFIAQDNVAMAFAPAGLLTEFRMAGTDADIASMKTSVQLMSDVFAKWKRISHSDKGVFPAVPGELTSWAYDAPTDKVTCTINSGTVLGLVSPYAFDEYTFDVVVSSTGADDDGIGLILAFKNAGGVEHSLIAHITTGGLDWNGFNTTNLMPSLKIVKNMGQTLAQGLELVYTKNLGPARQTFPSIDFVAGVRIKAIRNANGTMSVQAMKPDGTNFSGGEVKWTGDIPELFKSKCPIGYYTYSQPQSTYTNITVPQPKSDIVDSRNMDLHRWNNTTGTWSVVGKADLLLPKGRLYKNTEGNLDAFYLDLDGKFVKLGTASSSVVAVNEFVTLPIDGKKQYDLQTLLGSAYLTYDLKAALVTVLAKDTSPSSPLFNAYANAEGLIVYGIKDNRYVIVANQSGASIDLYVKVAVQPIAV